MRVGVLTHDNGSIPADKWADETAAQIVDIIQIEPESLAYDALAAQKREFEQEIAEAMVKHHDAVQAHECAALDKYGEARHEHPLTPEQEHLEGAVNDVLQIASTKIFAKHFQKPEVIEFVRHTVGSHFATAKNIERSWALDRRALNQKGK